MNDDRDERTSEEKMRQAFDARREKPFTDEEWEEAKRNLVGLFLMLGTETVPTTEDES